MLFSHLDYFDHSVSIGDVAKQNVVVNRTQADREFTLKTNVINPTTNEKTLRGETLEIFVTNRIHREMDKIADMVHDGMLNVILITIDIIITQWIELGVRSKNACSGRQFHNGGIILWTLPLLKK